MNNEVEQIISKIVSSEGISILKDSKKFISLFDDLAPELIEERKIFHRGLNDIILNQICEIYSSKENSKLNLLKEFYQRIQKDQGLSQEWSKLIILSFFNALNVKEVNNLNFKIDTPPETISTVDVEPHKMTLKEAEEHYDKKSNEKEIALSDGGLYVGEAVADKPHGHGKCIYKNGDIYVGDWAFGVYNGNGRYTWANGDSCECVWKDGKRNGQGVFCYADEQVWRGEFKLDLFWNGEGIQKLDNGDYYDGCLKNGKREGKGTIYYNDGKKCVGEWRGDFLRL